MKFYTEEQVKEMLFNSIDRTMRFAENGGIMDEPDAQEIIKKSFVHATDAIGGEEIQKQIEAVRGLVGVKNMIPLAISDLPRGAYVGKLKELDKNLTKHLKELTATLKPHLNGEKLEV